MTIVNTQRIMYEIVEGRIHHFTMLELSPAAIDEFFDYMETITHDMPTNQTACYLIVSHAIDEPPMVHVIRRANAFFTRYHQRPVARLALLGEKTIVVDMVDKFLRKMSTRDKTRFFSQDEYDLAVNWLLAENV